jgi:hypothetical protein
MSRQADQTHRRAQRWLGELTAARLKAVIAALPDPRDQTAMDTYNTAAVPIVAGGQHRSAQLALAYLAAVAAPRTPASVDRALRGVLVTGDSPVTRSPILRMWSLIDHGQPAQEAAVAAGSYAEALASNDLQVAEHAGLEEGARVAGERIVGWRKELDPGCCDWCQLVGAERIYKAADTVPFHERDRCSVSPVLAGEE